MSQRVKMNAPAGASGFSHDGEQYSVENGQIEVRSDHVDVARSHGYTLASGEEAPALQGRPAMVASIVGWARTVAESLSDEELIAFTSMPEADQSEFWKKTAEGLVKYPAYVREREAKDAADEKAAEEAEKKRLAEAKAKAESDAKNEKK